MVGSRPSFRKRYLRDCFYIFWIVVDSGGNHDQPWIILFQCTCHTRFLLKTVYVHCCQIEIAAKYNIKSRESQSDQRKRDRNKCIILLHSRFSQPRMIRNDRPRIWHFTLSIPSLARELRDYGEWRDFSYRNLSLTFAQTSAPAHHSNSECWKETRDIFC